MRLIAAPVLCLCLATLPALAAEPDALDLSLPQASAFRNDPPGTFYGDTSGVPASAATTLFRRNLCPTSPDGEETKVTGSVSTGMGYSSNLGSSTFGGASLNYCNTYTNDNGDERTINMRLDMNTFDGPVYGPEYRGPDYRMGPRGAEPAFGPGPMTRGGGR